jgi:hypothetical protein
MIRSATVLFLVLVAAGSAACGARDSPSKPKAAAKGSATNFKPPDGWFTAETSEPPDPQGDVIPVAWASNVPFVDDPADRPFPDRTVKGLSADGVVVEAVGPWLYTGDEDVPRIDFPLTLSDLYCLANGYEGQPAPNVSFCHIATRVAAEILNAYVYFGRNEPTPEMTAEANDVLATLSVSR